MNIQLFSDPFLFHCFGLYCKYKCLALRKLSALLLVVAQYNIQTICIYNKSLNSIHFMNRKKGMGLNHNTAGIRKSIVIYQSIYCRRREGTFLYIFCLHIEIYNSTCTTTYYVLQECVSYKVHMQLENIYTYIYKLKSISNNLLLYYSIIFFFIYFRMLCK